VGFHGPWGTTYAANLRLKAAGIDEAGGLEYTANPHRRPLMPDHSVRDMTAEDRLAPVPPPARAGSGREQGARFPAAGADTGTALSAAGVATACRLNAV
jgi:hypothetical protein